LISKINEDEDNALNIEVNDLNRNDIKWRTSYLLSYSFYQYLIMSTRFTTINLTYKDKKNNPYVKFTFDCRKRNIIKSFDDFIENTIIKKYF